MTLTVKTCASCGAEIIWAETENGKRMPLDAAPVAAQAGAFVLVGHPNAPQAVSLSKHLDSIPLFVSHFSTCPNAPSHRKSR